MEKVRKALEFNNSNGLYQGDKEHIRVYATFDGGVYDKQRTSIKSIPMLDKYVEQGQEFKDIEIITTGDAWSEYFKGMEG